MTVTSTTGASTTGASVSPQTNGRAPNRAGGHTRARSSPVFAPRMARALPPLSPEVHKTPAKGNKLLRLGSPNDLYEHEAERIADKVTSYPSANWSLDRIALDRPALRMCARCGCPYSCPVSPGPVSQETVNAGSGLESSHSRNSTGSSPVLRRSPDSALAEGEQPGLAPSIVHEVLDSAGQPLDSTARSFFEQRFQRDFSGVRIHADAHGAASAQAVNARAYTVGQHIVFAAGHYAPSNPEGRRLLAHELTHTVQQSSPQSPASPLSAAAPAVTASAGLRLSRQPDTPSNTPPPAPAATPSIRIVRIDNDVIDAVGRDSVPVASRLRALSADANVRLEINRGAYIETTRVSGNLLAARKALIQKLNIRIVDEPLSSRAATYEQYSGSRDFPTHGTPKITGSEAATLKDLPNIASAKAGGEHLEFWTFDARARANAEKLGVRIAPECDIHYDKTIPANYENILKLVPEVKPADLAAHGSGSGGSRGGGDGGGEGGGDGDGGGAAGGGGHKPAPGGAGAAADDAAGSVSAGRSAAPSIGSGPVPNANAVKPLTNAEIIENQRFLSEVEASTAESARLTARIQGYVKVFGGLLQVYTALSIISDAQTMLSEGTLFGPAQANADKVASTSAEDLDRAHGIADDISLVDLTVAVGRARDHADPDTLFKLAGSVGEIGSSLDTAAHTFGDMAKQLDLRVNALNAVRDFYEKLVSLPTDPFAGTIPQTQAFEMYQSVDKFTGPLATAARNYHEAADLLNYYAGFAQGLAHQASKTALIINLSRAAAQQAAAAAGNAVGKAAATAAKPPAQAHTTPPGAPLPRPVHDAFPSVKEQQGSVCPNCHAENKSPTPSGLFKPPSDDELRKLAEWYQKQ